MKIREVNSGNSITIAELYASHALFSPLMLYFTVSLIKALRMHLHWKVSLSNSLTIICLALCQTVLHIGYNLMVCLLLSAPPHSLPARRLAQAPSTTLIAYETGIPLWMALTSPYDLDLNPRQLVKVFHRRTTFSHFLKLTFSMWSLWFCH